ncbi:transcription factor bHLH110-like [Cucurbita moschata]|uniref:Transcription factor bHLH110-like n=1 Tax=Cucurbita moschata TaxID=3662 RepID=A0A6J1HD96_CUCMO|nr:transcription factor bHLH110-like [Cucurbita moschata]
MESANLQELFSGYSSLVPAPRPPLLTHECIPNTILDGNSYNNNNPYLMDQTLPCSRENENPWFNFSSNYQQQQQEQPNEHHLSNLYSCVQSPTSYGGFQGLSTGSNTNYYSNVFSSSTRNSTSTTSTLDLLSSSSLQAADPHLGLLSSGFNKKRALFGYVQDSIHNNSSNRVKRPLNSSSLAKKSNAHESKRSCPPLKVRKEKLGDRISALQRLVAPFGKTDTSSVLTEAIGYIQFLHDQVETLSMPYLGSSQSKPYQKLQPGSTQEDGAKPRPDLRSRGLCLMPLSWASFIHGYD